MTTTVCEWQRAVPDLTSVPSGVPGLMVGSICFGLAFLALYAVTAVGPNLTRSV